ncbi:MAG: hypothetical protein OEW60_04665 [Thiovulaceae bacterium]|nr:hypothetical protein [Sulfurimonadaceae bacterium]
MKKIVFVTLIVLLPMCISAENKPVDLTIRGAIGTDPSLGIAYGVGVYHKIAGGKNSAEVGVNFYGAHSSETSTEFGNDYTEDTSLAVITVMYNFLYNYDPKGSHIYLISGVGVGLIGYDWTESSSTDTSLGTLLPGGGSTHGSDGTAFGNMLNLGIGKVLANGLDLRFEVPIFVMYNSYYDTAAVAIAITASIGKDFSF